jgi:acyl-homoserine-lactone acylase
MIAEQGTVEARWGGIQYMQRGTIKLPVQGFGYVLPGSDLAAVSPASAGGDTLKSGQSRTTFGSSFRMIVSLEPRGVQSWSVLPYGNSSNDASPHFADQMDLYAVGKYKPTYFGLSGAKKTAVKSYRLIH